MRVSRIPIVVVIAMTAAMICSCATMGEQQPAAEEEIRAVLVDGFASLKRGDIEKVMAVVSDDYMDSRGADKSALRLENERNIAQETLAGITFNLDRSEIVLEGSSAVVKPVIYESPVGNSAYEYRMKKEGDGLWRLVGLEPIVPPAVDIWAAALGGDIETIKHHLLAGTDVNGKNAEGQTPLHFATAFGHIDSVAFLLENGADTSARRWDGQTALDLVAPPWSPELEGIYRYLEGLLQIELDLDKIKAARPEIAALLREHAGKAESVKDDIWSAASGGDLRAIQRHIAAGADLNMIDSGMGNTPLIWSAVFGQTKAARMLIESGVDVDAMNRSGDTALHASSFYGQTEIVKLLLEKGADTSSRNQSWQTPLETIALPWSPEVEGIYQYIGGVLKIELDLAKIRAARPEIADLLRQHDG
jgi:hypothetical protein